MAGSSPGARVFRAALEDDIGAFEVSVAAFRRPRARNYKIWIEGENLVGLSYPYGTSLSAAVDFLKNNAAWVRKRLADYSLPQALTGALAEGREIYVDGRPWKVSVKTSAVSERFIEDSPRNELLLVCLADQKNPEMPNEESARRVFLDFCRAYIARKASEIALSRGVNFSRIEVRNQKGCWASRSASGTLSINWRMVFLPPELQNYLVCHELAHARFMDHSVSFWIWLSRLCPNARSLDRKLSELGGEIFKIGR